MVNNLCPHNYVSLPPNFPYTTKRLCVAKYEMKQVGSTVVSQAPNSPYTRVSRNNAVTQCQSLGAGYDLITNDEWQAVARNIELVPGNWGGGFIGSAQGLSIGVTASVSQVASVNDNEPCIGVTLSNGETCDSKSWHINRRTFTLSNGEVIWDMAGNVWEWVKDDNDAKRGTDDQVYLLSAGGIPYAFTISSTNGKERDSKGHFGPLRDYSGLDSDPWGGLGKAWLNHYDRGSDSSWG